MQQPLVLFYFVVVSTYKNCVCCSSFRSFRQDFLHSFSILTIKMYCLFASFSVARVSHDDEAKLKYRERHRFVTGGIQGNGEGDGSGRTETVLDKIRKETAHRLAKY